jgi:hypothetical protein
MDDYQLRIIAFIDILGFSQLIKESSLDKSKLNAIQNVLKYLKTWESNGVNDWGIEFIEIEEDAQKKEMDYFKIAGNTTCTCFSDSIVVSVLCDDKWINEITSTLIANLSFIGAKLIQAGILLRGGITIGSLIHSDDGIIMGQALIDAYELENKYAKYPRIILSDVLLKRLNYPLLAKYNRYPYHQYLYRFDDGCVGFHQIIFYQVMQSVPTFVLALKKDLSIIRHNIIEGLDNSFERPDVFIKYKWLADQYNKLIILEKNLISQIHDVRDVDNSHNIHYSNIDKIKNMNK